MRRNPYRICAIASVLAFTAVVPPTFASAPPTKIYPNKGCLRVINAEGGFCELKAVVNGKAVDWRVLVRKKNRTGTCNPPNIQKRPTGNWAGPIAGAAQFTGAKILVREHGYVSAGPQKWSLCP